MTTSNTLIGDINNPQATQMFDLMITKVVSKIMAKNNPAGSSEVLAPAETKNEKIPVKSKKESLLSNNIVIKPKAGIFHIPPLFT